MIFPPHSTSLPTRQLPPAAGHFKFGNGFQPLNCSTNKPQHCSTIQPRTAAPQHQPTMN